jgi:hypothetical protein
LEKEFHRYCNLNSGRTTELPTFVEQLLTAITSSLPLNFRFIASAFSHTDSPSPQVPQQLYNEKRIEVGE